MLEKQQKPKFLNLFQISMPVTAIVSILHRVSGLLLVISLPLLITIFYLSTLDATHFNDLKSYFDSFIFRLFLLGVVWVVTHHVFAGIRYLLIDIEIGISLPKAKLSAWIANIAAILVTAVIALEILL